MNKPHSTLKLAFGNEPCFYKLGDDTKEYDRIFDVVVDNLGSKFEKLGATAYQTSLFWRQYSRRLWSYDDFSFNLAGAAVSFIKKSNIYRVWYNPLIVYEQMITAPFVEDIKDEKQALDNFRRKGKIATKKTNSEYYCLDRNYYDLLLECRDNNKWSEEAWKQHCQYLVGNAYYRQSTIGLLVHEMMHVLWNHCLRGEGKDREIYNYATDYAINQKVDLTIEQQNMMIHDNNPEFWKMFVYAASKWQADKFEKARKIFEQHTKNGQINYQQLFLCFVADPTLYHGQVPFFPGLANNNNRFSNRDSDFYYDILMNMLDVDKMSGASMVIDTHETWEMSDEEQEECYTRNEEFADDDGNGDIEEYEEGKGLGGNEEEDEGNGDDKNGDDEEDAAGSSKGEGKSNESKGNKAVGHGDGRSKELGGDKHPGFDNLQRRNQSKNIAKRSLKEAGFDPDDPESLEQAMQYIPGFDAMDSMFHEWFTVKTKNWRRELAQFLMCAVEPTELDFTMMREHRALDDVFPGKKRDIGFDAVIGMDTSASIGGIDFNDFINQVYKIARDCNINKARVIQCHTSITSDEYFRISSLKKLKEMNIVEIGGTKMEPIFCKLKDEKNKKPLILFTDGEIDNFKASSYTGFKHIIFLSRGHSHKKKWLESNGFKVICQDDEKET